MSKPLLVFLDPSPECREVLDKAEQIDLGLLGEVPGPFTRVASKLAAEWGETAVIWEEEPTE